MIFLSYRFEKVLLKSENQNLNPPNLFRRLQTVICLILKYIKALVIINKIYENT